MFREKSLNVLQQQYGYTNVSDLILKKAAIWDKYMGNIAGKFVEEVLDFNTCTSSALDYYWGKILKITRTFTDDNGNLFSLNDEQFREIIKIRAFSTTWDGTIATLNEFLKELFYDRGHVYAIDRQNMTSQVYVFTFRIEEWEKYLFLNKDILPRCAGIGVSIYELTSDDIFGFEGTEFQPFNQGVFWNGRAIYR